ncbi:MAG: hypothetical protein IH586_09115 [Anaerolineaceae bacterium]|nr:hypothetical protein [Anaerolineaceae bacterium]
MTDELEKTENADQKHQVAVQGGGSSSVYGIGMIGAWVYYFKRATTTQEKVKAFLKGLVWPAFLVYDLYVYLEKSKQA